MQLTAITEQALENRSCWISKISCLSGDFSVDAERIAQELSSEIHKNGISSLLGHLRLCGVIPEEYGHDSSEEKLYSKYTDAVIHEAYSAIGFASIVLKERADAADVECVCDDYSFVADAKAFRLSRTAKNQKDFKIQAMDNWKHGKPFAVVICPVYQLPARTSQIYQQAAARSVCIWTYTHLALLVQYAKFSGKNKAKSLLYDIFRAVEAMNPSKDACMYWQVLNHILLKADDRVAAIWRTEKLAALESIKIAREEALAFLAAEREWIMRLSREEAIQEVLKQQKIENRMRAVRSVADNGLLELGETA